MHGLAPIIPVPRGFWDREYGGCPLPKAVTVIFEVAGQPVDDVSAHGFVSMAEDSELRLSGLWAVCQDRFPDHMVVGWSRVGDDTIKLQLQPPESADEQHAGIDRKRQAPADLPEPQAKVQALGARLALEWDSPREPVGAGLLLDWRQDGARLPVEQAQRLVAPNLLPGGARFAPRRGGSGGRMRGGSRATATGRGCAKLVRTTTRLYIGVGQVREWLGEVGARTELQVKVMLDNRMLNGVHQADLLYNKGAHYYWITSRTLKRTAMGKWFLGWSHTPTDGLVLLLRSPSKDEIAAAIAEGFQGKEDEEDTEVPELQLQMQQQLQQQMLHVLSPPSPHPARMQSGRSLTALAYGDEDAMMLMQQQTPASEMEDFAEGGQYHRTPPLGMGARLGPAGDEDDAVSGLSGESELRRALGPSDPRLMVALAAAELQQRGMYPGSGTPGAATGGRRPTPGSSAGPGAGTGRGYTGARDARDLQQPLPGRQQAGAVPAAGGAPVLYRDFPARSGSDGLNAAGGGVTPTGQPRNPAPPPARYTNFSEVPGGTAFANVPLPSEHLGLEPQPPLPQPHRGGAATMPSQLGATTSIASNLSLAGATQLTGAASMLQASGVAGPVAAPLRLPTNVSELLPPEYLPAAVSVRCTLDGSLQPDIFGCEIHRNRQGHCYLYNLPPTVLEGRSQQDWMISEDGCLVLCLKTVQQANLLAENKSVRSNPSNPQVGAEGANVDTPAARGSIPGRGQTSVEKPSGARPQHQDADADVAAAPVRQQAPELAGGAGTDLGPRAPDHHEQRAQAPQEEDAAAAAAAEPDYVVAALPVAERRSDGRRERPPQLSVPRQAIESLYGNVLLPHPVLLRYQIDGEPEQQVYLAEVADAGAGDLYLRGASMEPLVGRTLTGWRRGSVLSHQLLVVCLETRPDAAGQGRAGTVGARGGRDEEPRRGRNDQAPSPQQQPHGQPSPHQQQQAPANWGALGETQLAGSRPPVHAAAANPFGQQQPSLTAMTASHLPSRPSTQQPLGAAAGGSAPHRQPPQHLQPSMSGPLPGVGSSMLPPSLSLMNNGSTNLLPAQASNLPYSASNARPEGNASAAVGGTAGGRPASAGARGGGAAGAGGGGAAGQRSPSLNHDGAGGGMLQTLASATQAPAQAQGSKPATAGRAPPAAPMFPWEGAAAGQAAPTVFAFGLGQEPSSPKAAVELSASGKRTSQPQLHAQGRGTGTTPQHSVAAESALMPRNTVQTADFSSANAASHVRGGAQQYHPPSQQHSLHPGPNRRTDDNAADHELRRGSGGAANGGSGDLDAAMSNRPRRQPCVVSESEGLAESAPVTAGGQGESGPTMRHLPSQPAHGGGFGALAAEPAVPAPNPTDTQQPRSRTDRSQGPASQSWRFDVHGEPQQRADHGAVARPGAAAGDNDAELPESQPSLASLPAGGLGREGGRWGDARAQGPSVGGDEARGQAFSRYPDESRLPGATSGRAGAATDDVKMTGGDERQGGGAAPSSRVPVEAADPRLAQDFAPHGEVKGNGWADALPRRAFAAEAHERGDVEMEDVEPGAATAAAGSQPGRAAQPAYTGIGAGKEKQSGSQGTDIEKEGQETVARAPPPQHNQTASGWQRRGDSGHALQEPSRDAFNPPLSAADPSRQPLARQESGATAALDHNKQSQQQQSQQQQPSLWFPRLDLTGACAPNQEQGAAETATAPKASEDGRAGREEGELGEEDKPPPRRGVLRMLSAVVREPDEGDAQQLRRS
ncbi:hypothetical protein PLESTM_000511600 [Pleodorina starrii]|nr:hypothetical protein PLESTM_000511600 [Pleodorina starrii]